MFSPIILAELKEFLQYLVRKKLKYFPFLNLHRRLISFIYRAVFQSPIVPRQHHQARVPVLKENLYRILKITDGDAPPEGASWTTEAALSTWLSYSGVILLQSLHPMILKTRPLLLHSAIRKQKAKHFQCVSLQLRNRMRSLQIHQNMFTTC